jgi:hypothetical protein
MAELPLKSIRFPTKFKPGQVIIGLRSPLYLKFLPEYLKNLMSRLKNQLREEIKHQLAVILGMVELPLALEQNLHREELRVLRSEILKLGELLRRYSEPYNETEAE